MLLTYWMIYNVYLVSCVFSPRRIYDPEGGYNLGRVRPSVRALAAFSHTCIIQFSFKFGAKTSYYVGQNARQLKFLIKVFFFDFWGNLFFLTPPPYHLTEFSREKPNLPEADALTQNTNLHMNSHSHVRWWTLSALYVLFCFLSFCQFHVYILFCFSKKQC